jgi:precorrin-2/cobalt-factor-2 C20-methyltransferase
MYVSARLTGGFPVEVVPGVSGFGASAALAGQALVARNEVLTMLPATLEDSVLRDRLLGCDAVVIMKVGRHLDRLRRLFEREGYLDRAFYVERASMPGEQVRPLAEARADAPYFSMILLRKGGDPWL